MMLTTYIAYIERSKDGFGAFFPDLPGCATTGDTLPEVLSNAQEALALHIEGMEEDGDTIPQPAWDGQEQTLDPDYQGGNCHCVAGVSVETAGKLKRVNVTLPENLLDRIDAKAGPRGRSAFLASAAKDMLSHV